MGKQKPKGKARYVIAVDGSPGSRRALDVGVTLARGADASVEVVVVEDFAAVARAMRPATNFPRAMAKVREGDEALVVRGRMRASRAGVEASHRVLRGSDPAAEIVRRAQRTGASVIVVGSRGRSPLRKVALGSVAEKVARLAPCTVVVVR